MGCCFAGREDVWKWECGAQERRGDPEEEHPMTYTRATEDFPSVEAAIAALRERGFEKRGLMDEHYRHPTATIAENGKDWVARADVFAPRGSNIGRISYWPAIA
jgi:hypothetical protein